MDNQLSPHFTLAELTASDTAARRGIDNTPTPAIYASLKRTAEALETIRALGGKPIIVTSGYRSPALNAAVGGAGNSAHLTGLAADINRSGSTPYDFGLAIINSGLEFDQIIHEYGRWVHIGLAAAGQKPRRQLLTIRTGTGYLPGWLR